MALQFAYPVITAEDFLTIDFSRGLKAELDDGAIRMIDGVTAWHAIVQGNLLAYLRSELRGSGCMPYFSTFPIRTTDRSVRRADVTIYCGREGPEHDDDRAGIDPRVIFEIHEAGTARTDLRVKIDEYKAMSSVETIVLVDIAVERVRVIQRAGPSGWLDDNHREPHDIALPALGITIPHAEIFARD